MNPGGRGSVVLTGGRWRTAVGFIQHWVGPRCGEILREVKGIGQSAAGMIDPEI